MYIVAAFFFWAAVGLVFYAYVVYPLLILKGIQVSIPNGISKDSRPDAELPDVSVIVAAYNEEVHIGARIENLLQQDYPPGKLTILVGSDGSSDRTVEIAESVSDPRVRVLAFTQNRGKASVLNDCVVEAKTGILVFTDANTVFATNTVRELVAALDENTAVACGELILQAPARAQNMDHGYWNVERRLKAAESSIGGLIGANGGVYALRHECFIPILPDTICDDLVIAMNVGVTGKRVRYVPSATAFEETPKDIFDEYHRRVRIGIGNYQAMIRHPQYLFRGPVALRFTYFSHKVLRWLTPLFLVILLACSLFLGWTNASYGLFAALQLLGYSVAVVLVLTRQLIPWPRPFRSAMLFAVVNWAFLVGLKRYLFADYRGSWRRTERSPS